MIKIIRKVDIQKQYEQVLQLELDYELATLFDAMKEQNELDIKKSKQRLHEIYSELQGIAIYA